MILSLPPPKWHHRTEMTPPFPGDKCICTYNTSRRTYPCHIFNVAGMKLLHHHTISDASQATATIPAFKSTSIAWSLLTQGHQI
eukprot:6498615-Ditylum_brightwellii.AAC.1